MEIIINWFKLIDNGCIKIPLNPLFTDAVQQIGLQFSILKTHTFCLSQRKMVPQ